MALPALAGAAATALGASAGTSLAAEAAAAAGVGLLARGVGSLRAALAGIPDRVSEFARGVAVVGVGLTAAATAASVAGEKLASFVAKFSPAAVVRFHLAADNLTAAIGRLLLPVLDRLTLVVKAVGDGLASLTQAGNVFAAGVVATGAILGVATAVAVAFGAAVSVAFAGIPAVVGAVAGAMAGLAFVTKDTAEVQAGATAVMREANRVLNAFAQAARALKPALEPAAAATAAIGRAVADTLVRAAIIAAPAVERVGAVVAGVMGALADALGPLAPVFDRAVGVVAQLGATLAEWFGAKVGLLAGLLADLAPGLDSLIEGVGELIFAGWEAFADVLGAVAEAVFEAAGGSDGLNDALTTVAGALRFVAREVLPALARGLVGTIEVVATGFGLLRDVLLAVTLPLRAVYGLVADLLGLDTRFGTPPPVEYLAPPKSLDSLKPGAADGLAVRGVQTSDLLSTIRRAQERAFGGGMGPAEKTASNTGSMAENLGRLLEETQTKLPMKIASHLAEILKRAGGQAYRSASDSTAGQVVRATVPGLAVADWLARQTAQQVAGN